MPPSAGSTSPPTVVTDDSSRGTSIRRSGSGPIGGRGGAVGGRDRVVALAPDDQRRHAREQVQAVGGADALAARVDDRAQRVHERPPRPWLLERAQRAGDGLQVDALGPAALTQALAAALE